MLMGMGQGVEVQGLVWDGGRGLDWVVRLVAEAVGEGWGWCRLAELS